MSAQILPGLAQAQELRAQGLHEEACNMLTTLANTQPHDASLQYQTACVHDFLGKETAALPYYRAALSGQLDDEERLGAYLGMGSTLRVLGDYQAAFTLLSEAVALFPCALELQVFQAMAAYHVGEHKAGTQTLLQLLAKTSNHAGIGAYRRAISLYAEDLDRRWD